VKSSRKKIAGAPIKLLRQRMPIELTSTQCRDDGGITLEWSTTLQSRGPVPVAHL